VLFKSVERFERSRFGFGGVDPRVLFIPSCPGYTGLTGALDRSDRGNPWWVLLGWTSGWACCCPVRGCFEFGSVWRSVGLFGDLGAFRLGPVWPVCCTGVTGVKPLSGSCQLSTAGTGLTGGAHRSDRCWSVDSRFGVPLRSRVGRLCVGF
jgi:hypothetical protein